MDDKEQARREARRKRRIRNQAISYIALVLFVVGIAAAVVMGLRKYTADRQAAEASRQSEQDKLNDMLASEDEIQRPEPSSEPESDPVAELTPEEKLDEIINEAVIEAMPLEDKVAGLFIVTPEAITGVKTAVKAGEGTKEALAKYGVGGFIYFKQNIKSKEQFSEMLDNTQAYARYPLFLAVDEEGGRVARLSGSGIGEKVDAAAVIGQSRDTEVAYQSGVTLGKNLAEVGMNLDFAPVADLSLVEGSVIGDRSYGGDTALVCSLIDSVTRGIQDQGVSACLKHFPGMGGVVQDPHKGISGSDRTEEMFRAEEFPVFQAGIAAGVDVVMVSNISAPALTGNAEPCLFSQRLVTDILRSELGFEGVIITDAMNMAAVSDYYGSDEAAIMALKAGCDMILMPEDFEKAYNGVLGAVRDGTISEERIDDALRRIYRIKWAYKMEQ